MMLASQLRLMWQIVRITCPDNSIRIRSACKPSCRVCQDVKAPGQLLLMRQAHRVSPLGTKTGTSPARITLCAPSCDTRLRYSSQCDPDTAPEGIWSYPVHTWAPIDLPPLVSSPPGQHQPRRPVALRQ